MAKLNSKGIATFLIILFSLFIILIYFSFEFYDYYAYSTLSLTYLTLNHGSLPFRPMERSGFVESDINVKSTLPVAHSLLAVLSYITSISPERAMFFPIAVTVQVTFILLTYKLLIEKIKYNKINKYIIIGKLFILFIGLVITVGPTIAGPIFYISLGYSYLFIFMYLLFKIIANKAINIQNTLNLVILYIVSSLTYYASIYIMLALTFSVILYFSVIQTIKLLLKDQLKIQKDLFIRLFFIGCLVFFIFTLPIYQIFSIFFSKNNSDISESFIVNVQLIFSQFVSLLQKTDFISNYKPIKNYIDLYVNIQKLYHFSLLLTLVLSTFIFLIKVFRENFRSNMYNMYFLLFSIILLLGTLFQILAYFSYGQVTYTLFWFLIGFFVSGILLTSTFSIKNDVCSRVIPLNCLYKALLILASIVVISGTIYRILNVADSYYVYYFSYAEHLIFSFLANYSTSDNIFISGPKFYFISVATFLGLNYSNLPRFFLNSEEFISAIPSKTNIYYIDYNAPFEFFGVRGVVSKELILRNLFGVTEISSLSVIYDSNIFLIFYR